MAKFVLDTSKISETVLEDLKRSIIRCKQSHWTDLCIRINGKEERIEADWIKYMTLEDDD